MDGGLCAATNATRARDLGCTGGLSAPRFLRNFVAPDGRQFQLPLNTDGPLFFCTPCMAQPGEGRRGQPPAQKYGAVYADRLARKTDRPRQRRFHWCAKLSSNHARVAAAPIRGPEKNSCRPLAALDFRIKGLGSYPSLQLQGRINIHEIM